MSVQNKDAKKSCSFVYLRVCVCFCTMPRMDCEAARVIRHREKGGRLWQLQIQTVTLMAVSRHRHHHQG